MTKGELEAIIKVLNAEALKNAQQVICQAPCANREFGEYRCRLKNVTIGKDSRCMDFCADNPIYKIPPAQSE